MLVITSMVPGLLGLSDEMLFCHCADLSNVSVSDTSTLPPTGTDQKAEETSVQTRALRNKGISKLRVDVASD